MIETSKSPITGQLYSQSLQDNVITDIWELAAKFEEEIVRLKQQIKDQESQIVLLKEDNVRLNKLQSISPVGIWSGSKDGKPSFEICVMDPDGLTVLDAENPNGSGPSIRAAIDSMVGSGSFTGEDFKLHGIVEDSNSD